MDNKTSIFTFLGHTLDLDLGTASFSYQIDHNDESFEFTEELYFAPEEIDRKKINRELLQKVMDNLLLILGISYYKLFCPTTIKTSVKLTQEQADFWNTVYTKGLGEFFYKNTIDFHHLVNFPFSKNAMPSQVPITTSNKSLLFFAGGKDSIVSGELLKKANTQFTALTINPTDIQTSTLQVLQAPHLFIKRKIDEQLLECNKEGIGYNGHIPFNAIAAFIGIFAGVLYDFTYLITSNEHSANYGNVNYLDTEINHQWSKSFEFEKLLQEYMKTFITPDITYFSLLRPLYELKIVKLFSTYTQYFSHFSSCNKNFKIDNKLEGKRWCGECPKCLFAYILLSAFLSRKAVLEIFSKDLFTDENLFINFKQLLGLSETKPFECVGTPEETKLALVKIANKQEYADTIYMKFFIKEILPTIKNIQELERDILDTKHENAIPKSFKDILTAI